MLTLYTADTPNGQKIKASESKWEKPQFNAGAFELTKVDMVSDVTPETT